MIVEDEDGERRTGPDRAPEAVAAAALRAGRSLREIAIDLFGADPGSASGAGRVAAEWHPDGAMRAHVRRLVQRAATPGRKACE